VNSKDFIPPDVTGLSKREARLVKNRAAAFLSRQRKREEFETMEVRVLELEQENARLLALTQGGSASAAPSGSNDSSDSEELVSQIEQLKADLAAAQEREKQLSAQLEERASTPFPSEPEMKVEHLEPAALSQALASRPATGKSAASLGLMVLLCALPTLLSMPNAMRSTLPSSYEPFPAPASSAFDFNSFLTSDYDWNSMHPTSSMMDLDDDLDFSNPFATEETAAEPSVPAQADNSVATPQKLEFAASDLPEELLADSEANGLSLAGLDISFDAKPAEDGKIRVRIHTSSSGSVASTTFNSRASSPGVSSVSDDSSSEQLQYPIAAPELSQSPKDILSLASALPSPSASTLGDPFLGVGSSPDEDLSDFSSSYFNSRASGDSLMFDDFGTGSEYSYSGSTVAKDSTKKRVRIALKSMPSAGGEGGEWEVQLC